LAGLAGCTWIIGDIPVPDDVSVNAEAIAGAWYVYGLADRRAVNDRITIMADGAVNLADETVTRATLDDDGLWSLDLGEDIGRISGRFAPESGVGLMVEASPDDPAVFVALIREPTIRGSLLGGRTAQLELTDAGSPIAEFARLQRSQDDVYRQSDRITLTDAQLEARQVTVAPEGDDAPRWVVRTDDGDWLLSPLVSGDAAIGIRRSENGSPLGPMVVWRDPVSPRLPDRQLYCAGLTIEDGEVVSRDREARIQDDRIEWSDGRRGRPSTVAGAAVLDGDGSFYDDQGTLVMPDTNGRLFALLPLVPDSAGASPERSWGLALCIGLDAIDRPDPGVDAAMPLDAGVDAASHDAGPDGASALDAAPTDTAVEPLDAARDMAPPPHDAAAT